MNIKIDLNTQQISYGESSGCSAYKDGKCIDKEDTYCDCCYEESMNSFREED